VMRATGRKAAPAKNHPARMVSTSAPTLPSTSSSPNCRSCAHPVFGRHKNAVKAALRLQQEYQPDRFAVSHRRIRHRFARLQARQPRPVHRLVNMVGAAVAQRVVRPVDADHLRRQRQQIAAAQAAQDASFELVGAHQQAARILALK
jgi:hypothetical protein